MTNRFIAVTLGLLDSPEEIHFHSVSIEAAQIMQMNHNSHIVRLVIHQIIIELNNVLFQWECNEFDGKCCAVIYFCFFFIRNDLFSHGRSKMFEYMSRYIRGFCNFSHDMIQILSPTKGFLLIYVINKRRILTFISFNFTNLVLTMIE